MRCNDLTDEEVELSVVLPFHNEEAAIGGVVTELIQTLQTSGIRWEIILVDDGSTDASVQSLCGLLNLDNRIRMLSHDRRIGSGASRRLGMNEARSEWIAWIDGDGTYAPEDLLKLWQHRSPGTHLIGLRPPEPGLGRSPRRAAKACFCLLASLLWLRLIPDLNSGLRVMPTQESRSWASLLPEGFSCATVATLASLRFGQSLHFIPISYRARLPCASSKFRPLRDSLRLLGQILQWRFRPICK